MKILLINKFFFLKGGAEASFFATAEILERKGHKIIFFSMAHPENFDSPYSKYFISQVKFEDSGSIFQKIKASGRMLYSIKARNKLEQLVKAERPDIVHLHNIHHQISPSILHTLKKFGLPIVMSLHDYKMVCPVYTLLRKGKICEKCKDKKFYHCVFQRCSKDSFSKSFLNSIEMYIHHNILKIYDLVDIFISPSKFLKEKINVMGFKAKIFHLRNFININEYAPLYSWNEESIVYFGRLSQEKGLFTLLQALKELEIKCKIFGDGPLRKKLEEKAKRENLANISFLGYTPQEKLRKDIRQSMFVVLPSEWCENNPFSVVEAFALGKPVIGSNIGGIPELVENFKTGLIFEPGNPNDLREKILYLLNNRDEISDLGKAARKFSEQNFNPKKHYSKLMKLYQLAIEKHG
jgi:glycosyltransferase involved in cell wall biosynthesis